MHELTEICNNIGRTDKSNHHLYTEFYGPLLTPYRKSFTDILEIGVKQGGSLLMWKEFFPNATIWGMDNEGEGPIPEDIINTEGLNVYLNDAYDPKVVEELIEDDKEYDLILDDGPHTPQSQLFMLNNYVDLLKEDGILIIEDVVSMEAALSIADSFQGDRGRLSIIDRRATPSPRSLSNAHLGTLRANWDEIILLYM